MLNYIFALILFIPNIVFAQSEIPFNTPRNSIEYKASGNAYTWQPVPESTPKPQQPYRPDLSGGTASTIEPKFKYTPELPYEHKGGASAKATFTVPVDTQKARNAASKAAAAATAGMSTGNGYLAFASIACAFVCEPLFEALAEWGGDKLKKNDDGSLSVDIPDPSADYANSDGYYWTGSYQGYQAFFLTPQAACSDIHAFESSNNPGVSLQLLSVSQVNATRFDCALKISSSNYTRSTYRGSPSNCPAGSPVVNGVCNGAAISTVPLTEYLQSNYREKGWNTHWAKITAGLVAAGHNVFSDGTSGTIIGPRDVPLGTTEQSWPVNVIPGTTTEAPAGHTGPTDPGTKTSTTTKTATNTYSGNQQTTSTGTSTSTKVTNNITNNTSTSVTTNITQSDDAPEEKKEDNDFCKKNPDSLACAEMDTPEGEIPRDTIEIDFEPEDLGLGNGSCPADKPIDDLTVFSYQPTCDVLDTYVYPMTIVFAMFGALLIIFVGKADA